MSMEVDDDDDEVQLSPRSKRRNSRHRSRDESPPFYDHPVVRFSPSVKPGSSPRRSPSSRRRSLRRVRLDNFTSEDEQKEFNRKYSRDLRTRKRAEMKEKEEANEKSNDEDEGEKRSLRRSSR